MGGGGNLSHNSQQCQSGSDQHSTFFDDADYSVVAQFVFLTTSYSIISTFYFRCASIRPQSADLQRRRNPVFRRTDLIGIIST
jgi:hypothetical protein